MKIHTAAALAVLCAGFYFEVETWEWMALLGCIAMVISLELVNSALEYLTDMVQPEFDPRAGKVKDVAAGAVLFAAVIAAVIGAWIFGSYLLA